MIEPMAMLAVERGALILGSIAIFVGLSAIYCGIDAICVEGEQDE